MSSCPPHIPGWKSLAALLDSTSPFFDLCFIEAQRTMLLNRSKLLFFCTTRPWENMSLVTPSCRCSHRLESTSLKGSPVTLLLRCSTMEWCSTCRLASLRQSAIPSSPLQVDFVRMCGVGEPEQVLYAPLAHTNVSTSNFMLIVIYQLLNMARHTIPISLPPKDTHHIWVTLLLWKDVVYTYNPLTKYLMKPWQYEHPYRI